VRNVDCETAQKAVARVASTIQSRPGIAAFEEDSVGSTTSITPATFNGTSQYAGDLQKAITNAVNIASIPMNNLQNSVTTLQGQSSELSTLQSDFANIGSAITSLDSANSGNGLSASVSDSSVASATVSQSAAATAGTYTVKVITPGAATTTLSNNGLPTVADPSSTSISTSGTYTLTVGTSTFKITPAANNLNSLAQAINAAGDGVSATILNIGSPSSPDYRLSLQSTALTDETVQLNDGTQNLLSNLTTGSPAQYQVDGQPSTPISSNSSTVTIAPGVTVDLLQAGTTTVSVTPDTSAAENAISSFVAAYNAASTEINNNHGTNGGALTGQSIVLTLGQSLESLAQYTGGSGSVQNLADLGITIDSTGQMSFDQATFESATASDPNDVSAFLGSAISGTGFLGTAINTLNNIDDTTDGTIQSSININQQQITSDNTQITADQNSITTMQNNLTEQMSLADASIATLESQVTYFSTLFSDTQSVANNISNG
jgi:flagellar hook-associated protein 2